MNRNQILHAAVETFGRDSQMMMMVEEMSELNRAASDLTKAICKQRRSRTIREKMDAINGIKEEIVDVQIVLDQMKILFGYDEEIERRKLERLEKRIDEYKETEV